MPATIARYEHDPQLERTVDRVAGGLGYSVGEHEVVLTGACADCD